MSASGKQTSMIRFARYFYHMRKVWGRNGDSSLQTERNPTAIFYMCKKAQKFIIATPESENAVHSFGSRLCV